MGKTRYFLISLVLGALVIGLSSPAHSATLGSLGATLSDLKFYESPLDLVPVGERDYSAAFEKQSTRFIAYQFLLESPEPGRQVEIPLTVRYFRPDGRQMVQLDHPVRLQPSWTRSSHSWGYGWIDPGKWPPGRYTVKIFEGTREILSNAFTVHTDLEAADLLFNWLEALFPQILSPGARTAVPLSDLHYRHYTKTNVYLGTAKGDLYFLDERGELYNLGRVNFWLGHVDG